jgi:predicted ArsR family transcriptional regulator
MEFNLTDNEVIDLIEMHSKERDWRIKDHIKAVLIYHRGFTYEEIGQTLLISRETARQHLLDYVNSKKLHPVSGGSES